MELIIKAPSEGQFIKEIQFNKDEIISGVTESLKKYENLIYDEYSIKSAKADRATLNNFRSAIEDKRKEIKAKCLAPYMVFEADIKEITALIDKPLLAIDSQVKSYEDKKKQEKREACLELYDQIFENYKELVKFVDIENPRWMNTTYSLNKIGEEITEIYQKLKTGVDIIKGKKSEYEDVLLEVFLTTRDLEAVMLKEQSLIKTKEAIRKQEEDRKAEEERIMNMTDTPAPIKPKQEPQRTISQAVEQRQWYDFSIYLDDQELEEFKNFIKSKQYGIRRIK